MEINYRDIGLRIKKIRTEKGMTQDTLAELAYLSTPHMSHIETGNTKVSLPTLVRIANVLERSLDEFLCDSLSCARQEFEMEISRELSDCTEEEVRIIADTIKALKTSLRHRRRLHSSH